MARKDKRALIMDAGRAALLERGIAQLRLADVAGAAGLTPPGVLYHYPDIFKLFEEAFAVSVAEYCEARRAAVEQVSDPRERLRACIASGVPRAPHQIDTTRLLIELHPYVLREPTQLERWRDYVADQVEIYRAVLDHGAAEGAFVLTDAAERLGEDFIALEDGYSGSVVARTRTADYVEERLWAFAMGVCSIPPG
jgi:AcrR family transcriptional regulator